MLLVLAIVAVLALSASTASAGPSGTAPVTCGSIVEPGGSYSWRPRRVVLGVVALPPTYIPQTVRAGEGRWPYWSKAGLVVRAGSPPVIVRIPEARWPRAAIEWGDGGPAAALRIETCPDSSSLGGWNPYTGGFLLRSRSACVPVTFTVAGRSKTVRFGVGKRCD
jgi:hypothetical protein